MPKSADTNRDRQRVFSYVISPQGVKEGVKNAVLSQVQKSFRRGEAGEGFILRRVIDWAQSPESDARIHHGEFGDFKYLLKENPELLGEIIEAQLHFLITYISSRADGSEKRFAKILNNIETFLQRYAEANADSSQNLHDGIQAVSRSIVLVFRDRIGDDFTRESRTSNALISMVSWLFTESPLIETVRAKHTEGVKDSETTVPIRDALFQTLAKFPYLALAFAVSGKSAEDPLTTEANGLSQYISPTSGYMSPETRDMLTIALRFWPMLNISPRHLDSAGIQIPKDNQIADAQKRLVEGIWSLFDHGDRNMATKTEREIKHLLITLVAGLSPSSLAHIIHLLLGSNPENTALKEMIVAGAAVPALAAEQRSVIRLPEFARTGGQYAPSKTVIGVKEAAGDILTQPLFTVDIPLNLIHILAMFARLAKTRPDGVADGLIPIRDPKSADFSQDGAKDTDKTLGNAYRRLVDGTAVLYETLVASEKDGPLTLSKEKKKDKLSYFLLSLITLIEILSPKEDEPEEPKAVARKRIATLLLRMNRTVDQLGPDVRKTIFIPMLALIQDRWPVDVIESLMIQYHAELKQEMTKEGASWQILAQCDLPRRLILASPDLLRGEPQRDPADTEQLARLFINHMIEILTSTADLTKGKQIVLLPALARYTRFEGVFGGGQPLAHVLLEDPTTNSSLPATKQIAESSDQHNPRIVLQPEQMVSQDTSDSVLSVIRSALHFLANLKDSALRAELTQDLLQSLHRQTEVEAGLLLKQCQIEIDYAGLIIAAENAATKQVADIRAEAARLSLRRAGHIAGLKDYVAGMFASDSPAQKLVADTRDLLSGTRGHDRSGVLTKLLAALEVMSAKTPGSSIGETFGLSDSSATADSIRALIAEAAKLARELDPSNEATFAHAQFDQAAMLIAEIQAAETAGDRAAMTAIGKQIDLLDAEAERIATATLARVELLRQRQLADGERMRVLRELLRGATTALIAGHFPSRLAHQASEPIVAEKPMLAEITYTVS